MASHTPGLSPTLATLKEVPVPDPMLPVLWLRAAAVTFAILAVLQAWLRPALEAWGQAAATAMLLQPEASPAPNQGLRVCAALIQQLYLPTTQLWLRYIAAGLLGLLLIEAVHRLLLLTTTFLTPARCRTRFYRVRVLTPNNRKGFPKSSPAEHIQALATAVRVLRGTGVTLTLTRTPNMPATCGLQITTQASPRRSGVSLHWACWLRRRTTHAECGDDQAGAVVRRRAGVTRAPARRPLRPVDAQASTAMDQSDQRLREALRVVTSALKRFDETVLLDQMPDPLTGALRQGAYLLSAEFALRRPAHWPLRQSDKLESDLMRSLAQSLAASNGVLLQEVQIAIAPAHLVATMRWYGQGRRVAQRIRKQVGPLGTDDQKAVSTKVADTHLWATVRVVVVVASAQEVPVGRESLRVVESALHSLDALYQGPSHITVEQRLATVPGLSGGEYPATTLRGEPPQPPVLLTLALRWLTTATGLLAVGALLTWQLGLWRTWHDLPWWAIGGGAGLLSVTYGLAGAAGCWAAVTLRPWFAAWRVARPAVRLEPYLLFGPGVTWRPPALLGAQELASLWHLSGDQTTTEMATLPNRFLPAPESAFVPHGATDWVVLGSSYDSGGALRPVGLPLRALHQMMHVTAGMGAGKSQAAAAMCHQLIPHGFIILDGKGDDEGGGLAAVVRRYIPPEEEHRLVYLDVLDTAFPVSLNPIYHMMMAMEAAKSKAERDRWFNEALGMLLGLFQRLDPARWRESPGMQQYALMGCHLVLRTGSSRPGEIPTMAKVKRALEDETFRRALLGQYPFKYDDIYRFWTEREPEMAESQRTSLSALLRRLDLFLTNPITRAMLSVERPSVDLRLAMDEGGIVLIPMPHRTLGDLAPLVGMLIVQSIVAAAYARKGDALTRVTAPVFIDEVQVFIVDEQSPDLEQAFTQLRGFAVPLIVLHQTMKQLGALEETFRINAANRLILRTGEPDASVYAKMYAQSGLRPEDILAMQALTHQYAVTLGPNREQLVFSLIPSPWPAPPACEVGLHLGPRDWQEQTPPADVAWSEGERTWYAAIDRLLAHIIYQEFTPADFTRIVGQLAKMPAAMWDTLLERWERVRTFHRAYLLDHPAVIPGQIQRQTWLTRLTASRSFIIEEALVLRQELRIGGASNVVVLPGLRDAEAAPEGEHLPENMGPGTGGAPEPPTSATGDAPLAKDLRRQREPLRDEPTVYAALARKDTGPRQEAQAGGGASGDGNGTAPSNGAGEAQDGH